MKRLVVVDISPSITPSSSIDNFPQYLAQMKKIKLDFSPKHLDLMKHAHHVLSDLIVVSGVVVSGEWCCGEWCCGEWCCGECCCGEWCCGECCGIVHNLVY